VSREAVVVRNLIGRLPGLIRRGSGRRSVSGLAAPTAARRLTSDHKYLRICDLCKELEISAARCVIATERERQAKTDALFGAFVPVN